MLDDAVALDTTFSEAQREALHSQCGCADTDIREVVGWCLWCDHVYSEYTLAIENEHFAHHCVGAPEQVKESALALLAKRLTQE